MAFSREVLDEILKSYTGPESMAGPGGILKQSTSAKLRLIKYEPLAKQILA